MSLPLVGEIRLRRASRLAALTDMLDASQQALQQLGESVEQIDGWGRAVRARLETGGRLLVAGNGGSAALAQHLAAELVGRFDREREGFAALALPADTASVTAIGNDYGFVRCFARQVEAHGRPGDVLLGLSTSGSSPNLLAAAEAARRRDMVTWAMTGRAPNPLAGAVDDAVVVPSTVPSTIQDVQQVAVHMFCLAFELGAG